MQVARKPPKHYLLYYYTLYYYTTPRWRASRLALLAILLYSVLLYYCKVARKPPKHRWSCISAVGQPLVELMVTEHENDKGEKAEKTTV